MHANTVWQRTQIEQIKLHKNVYSQPLSEGQTQFKAMTSEAAASGHIGGVEPSC